MVSSILSWVFYQSLHYQNICSNPLKLSDSIQSKVLSIGEPGLQIKEALVGHDFQKPWYYVQPYSYHMWYDDIIPQPFIPYHGIASSYQNYL